MDDSDIVVLDDSSEEQPSTGRNVFSIASPDVCQRWTRPSSTQPPIRQPTWHKNFNQLFDYQPQPVITSVMSLSPQRNRPIIISEVKSLSPKQPPLLNGHESSYQRTKRSTSSYRISQPIITRVESLSPLKNPQKIIDNGSISISSQKYEPECIVLDDDDSNINLNGICNNASTDLNSLEIETLKTEPSDTLQVGCESNLNITSCESNNLDKNNPGEEELTSTESCEKIVTRDATDTSNPDLSKLNTKHSTNPTTSKKRIRPTSVGKDAPPALDAAKKLLEFKDACLAAADNENDMRIILDKKVEKSFNNTSQAFKKTSSFHSLLSSILQKVKEDPANVYVHISELITELKARKASEEDGEEPPTKKLKSSSKASKNVDYDALQNARDEMKMKKLSKTLTKLQKMIKKLECKEVTWEEENDSSYIVLQRFKQRAVKVFHKLCEYTKESKSAGKLNKIHLSKGTCFPEVNKCVENFVNKTGEFPDYNDILELMKEANLKGNMKLQENEIEDMAKKVFEEVGGELQKQRKHGVADSLLVFMEDGKGDPAEDSEELKEKLNENAKHWSKINDIIDDFATRAKEKKGNETESAESKSDDDDDDDDDDTEGEEDENADAEDESDKDLENIDVPDILKGDDEVQSGSEKSDNEDANHEEEIEDLDEPGPADDPS